MRHHNWTHWLVGRDQWSLQLCQYPWIPASPGNLLHCHQCQYNLQSTAYSFQTVPDYRQVMNPFILLGVSLLRSLRVANCVRVRTCACSAVHALVTRGWCAKPKIDSLKFDRRNKDVFWKIRGSNAYLSLVPLFSSFTGSVVCHTLPLFGKLPLGIISFDFLYDSFTRALPLLSFQVLSAFTLIYSTISHLWNQPCRERWCWRQYADVVLTLLRSFVMCDGSGAYTYNNTNTSSESNCCHQD